MGQTIPKYCPFQWRISTPANTRFLGYTRVSPKPHLDLFSRFCNTHERDQQTDRHTDRPRYSVCSNRPLLLWCGLIITGGYKILTKGCLAREGRIFHGGKLMLHQPVRRNAVSCSSQEWLTMAFQRSRQSPKIARSLGDLYSHLLRNCLGLTESPTQTTSRLVQPFCRAYERDQHTDRQTNRPRYCL